MVRTAKPKVNITKNYRLFGRSAENRPLDLSAHKRLKRSMEKYGFLSCFPIVCHRDAKGALIVKDGQHRLAMAETLGLPVYWIEETVDFDVAEINGTPKTWRLKDFAQKFAAAGHQSYEEGIEFSERHRLPLGISFAMLAGTTSFGNVKDQFEQGTFKIKDREWAESVAAAYVAVTSHSSDKHNARLVEACMSVCRVDAFSIDRLASNCKRCREKLVSYSTRDAYLEMLEEVYNFGRNKLVPLKISAMQVMKSRSPLGRNAGHAKKNGKA